MTIRKISAMLLLLSPILAVADEDSIARFENNVLTIPGVVAGDTVYKDVELQLNFGNNSFTLLAANPVSRFQTEMFMVDEVLVDNVSNLQWVNGTHACNINANAADTATMDVVEYCMGLEFAGHSDWRAPTSAEISDMIIHADKQGVKLNYINPACQFMAASDGFVQTENTTEPGKMVDSAVNSGSRCVRAE